VVDENIWPVFEQRVRVLRLSSTPHAARDNAELGHHYQLVGDTALNRDGFFEFAPSVRADHAVYFDSFG
jgi:hypothetical protein